MKIILDTNVLFSAFIRDSKGMNQLIHRALIDHEVFVTPTIVNEILGKADLFAPNAIPPIRDFLASDRVGFLDELIPSEFERVIIRDKNDQAILDAAISNDADAIITGDKDYHALDLERPRIMFPRDFAAEYLPNTD